HVLEVVATLLHAGRAPEEVERNRRVPALGEAERELLVEAVEAADVREDHDADAGFLLRRRLERCEAVPVGRLEHEVVVRDGRARDRRDRRHRVEVEAHAVERYNASTRRSRSPSFVHQPTEARTRPRPGRSLTITPASARRATTPADSSAGTRHDTSV